MSRLAHEVLQAPDGGVRALALAVGEGVVDEAFVPPRLDVPHEPLLHQPVGEGGREDLAQFGVGDGKDGERLRPVAPFGNGRCLFEHDVGQANEVGALVLAVAGFGGAGKKLPGDVGCVQGK